MAIVTSGALSLGTTAGTNRSISAEFGGTVPHALSEYYGAATGVPTSPNEIAFSDFYGTSAFSWGTPGILAQQTMTVAANRVSGTCTAKVRFGFQYRNTGSGGVVRAVFGRTGSNGLGSYSGTGSGEVITDLFSYSGSDPNSVEVRCQWTGTLSMLQAGSEYEPSDNAGGTGNTAWVNSSTGFRTIATGTSDDHTRSSNSLTNGSFTWGEWFISNTASIGTNSYRATSAQSGQTSLTMTAKAKDSNGNEIATSGTAVVPIFISVSKEGLGGGGGGPGGGGGGGQGGGQ